MITNSFAFTPRSLVKLFWDLGKKTNVLIIVVLFNGFLCRLIECDAVMHWM